jgi:ADP-ribose pyrophosphatase YjhB (NUDIX family)
MTGPIVAVGGVAVVDGALLMVRRGHGPAAGSWSVPGGRVELGETLHEAVVREVAEETGLGVVVDGFLGWTELVDEPATGTGTGTTDPGHYVILDFGVTPLDDPGRRGPIAGDDAAEVLWVPLGEVGDYRLAPGLFEFLVDVGVLPA